MIWEVTAISVVSSNSDFVCEIICLIPLDMHILIHGYTVARSSSILAQTNVQNI